MIGTTIDRFTVLEEIGRGGMGVVYLAHDERDDRVIALKVLPFADHALADRLRREAALLAELDHPHILQLVAVGEHEGNPYYAMAYCPGGSLADVGRANGVLTTGQLIGLLAPVADALGALHRHGIVHRDVKPSNVLLDAGAAPFLADFGLVHSLGASRATASGHVMGTIGYSAPELLAGGQPSPATDVFSFGVMAYELAAGRPPFAGVHISGVLDAVRRGEFVPLEALAAHLDPRLIELLQQCLAPTAASRPADLAELAARLREIAAPEPVAPMRRTASQMMTVAAVRDRHSGPRPSNVVTIADGAARRRRRRRLPVAVALLAALIAGGAYLIGRDGGSPKRERVVAGVDLPVKAVQGVRAAGRWEVIETDGIARVEGHVEFTNELDQQTLLQWDEVVPKELAADAADITASPAPSSVIDADPILRFCLSIEPSTSTSIRWTAALPAGGVDQPMLDGLVAPWSAAFDTQMAQPGGAACGGDDAITDPTDSLPLIDTSGPSVDPTLDTTGVDTTPPPGGDGNDDGGSNGGGGGGGSGITTDSVTTTSTTTAPPPPPPTPPAPVTGLVATAGGTSTGAASWSPSATAGVTYRVTLNGTVVGHSGALTAAFSGLAPSTTYTVTVVAVSAANLASPAVSAQFTTAAAPVGPTAKSGMADGARQKETTPKNLASSRYVTPGSAPIVSATFSAPGKPAGVGMSIGNQTVLSIYIPCSVPKDVTTWRVDFTLTDANGLSSSGWFTVTVSGNAAC